MAFVRWTRFVGIVLACFGMLLPVGVLRGAQPSRPTEPSHAGSVPQIQDVALAADGALRGRAVNVEGIGQARIPVVVRLAGREVARTMTNHEGNFSLVVTRGGVYEVQTGGQVRLYRLWAARTAPPTATASVLIVAGEDTLRAQAMPFKYWLVNPYFMTAVAAAAIGVPIAIHNANIDNRSGS